MKKTFLSVITVFIFASLFLSPSISNAVYFASDNISIYENGKKITNDSVIYVASYKTHSKKCTRGVCLIGQQFYPVTIHKAKNNSTLLTFVEFSSQNPYQGDKYDGPAKDRWHNQNKENYLSYLNENSGYSTIFEPPPSEGGGGCGYPGCIGGRIGDHRSYSFDIASGDYSEIPSIQIHENTLLPIRNIIIFLILTIVVLVLIIFFIKKRNKRLSKN